MCISLKQSLKKKINIHVLRLKLAQYIFQLQIHELYNVFLSTCYGQPIFLK